MLVARALSALRMLLAFLTEPPQQATGKSRRACGH
jgi:hypothetical protein